MGLYQRLLWGMRKGPSCSHRQRSTMGLNSLFVSFSIFLSFFFCFFRPSLLFFHSRCRRYANIIQYIRTVVYGVSSSE
ncbi:hypothetical protein BDV32DRAFT_131622 [Aspergillus pseudonomiae]|nr:hypothetical protein BDV32DRAFT_131622 [Aspergillus pseudonomiae]